MLHKHGFRYRSQYTYTIDEAGYAVARNLRKLVFWLPEQEALSRRFVDDFAVQIDFTFNTKRNRLLLGMATGVANTGKSYP
jgi:hypothetical protein